MGYTEINTVCDLCNCRWRLGPDTWCCDAEFTAQHGIPRIPYDCPRGYPAMSRGHRTSKERIRRIRRITLIVAELRMNGGTRVGVLAESIGERSSAVRLALLDLKRRRIVYQARSNGCKWALRSGVGDPPESIIAWGVGGV